MSRRRRHSTSAQQREATIAPQPRQQVTRQQQERAVRISKAGIEGGGVGARAIGARLSLEQASWQQNILINAGLYHYLYQRHPWVHAIVDKTASAAAADAYTIEPVSGDTSQDSDPRADAIRSVLDEIAAGGKPLHTLLKQIYIDTLVNGTCYLPVTRVQGMPVSIARRDFRTIVPRLDLQTHQRAGYDGMHIGNFTLAPEPIALEDVVCVQKDEMGDGGTGLSTLEALDTSLTLDISASSVNLGYMQNGTKSGDVFSFADTMSPDQIERERQYLGDNFSKPSQSYSPMFLAGGDMKLVKDGSVGRKDMDFLDLRRFTREEVASVYHMPLSLLSTDAVGALGGNGREQDLLMWNNDVIAPLQKLVFEQLNDQIMVMLLGVRDYRLVPPTNAGLRLELLQMAEIGKGIGLTGNQILKMLNEPPIDGLDKPLYLGKNASIVGIPGDPDSVVYTMSGAVSGNPQDPATLSSAGTTPAAETAPEQAGRTTEAGSAVKKAQSASANTRIRVSGQPAADSVSMVAAVYEQWASDDDDGLWETVGRGDGGWADE